MQDISFKYLAFISYSHMDEAWAQWLQNKLETYKLPKWLKKNAGSLPSKGLAPIFRDRDELPASASLNELVMQALKASGSLIVICSPNSVKSMWVNKEISYFRKLGRSHRIFCFAIDGKMPKEGTMFNNQLCLPEALWNDLSNHDKKSRADQPLVADARPGGEGRRPALLRLIAAILSISYNDLNSREVQRRNLKLILSTTLILSVIGVVGLIAFNVELSIEARNTGNSSIDQFQDTIPESQPRIALRSIPSDSFSAEEVRAMIIKHDFFCKYFISTQAWNNPDGRGLSNDFEKRGNIVFDRVTGLFWQRSDSDELPSHQSALEYIHKLNGMRFGGYSDWRLPTLEELMSLLESGTNDRNFHISNIFEIESEFYLTSDSYDKYNIWAVNFEIGFCAVLRLDHKSFVVRAVRVTH